MVVNEIGCDDADQIHLTHYSVEWRNEHLCLIKGGQILTS